MRYLLTLAFFCFSGSFYAQEVNQTVKKKRLQNFYVAPSFGYEIMKLARYDTGTRGYDVSYKGLPSVRTGLDIVYRFSEKASLNTGFFYAAKNFKRTESSSESTHPYFYNSTFKSTYYETFLGGTYNFVSGRFDMGVYGNLNFSFLSKASETRETESGNTFVNNVKGGQTKILTVLEPGLNFNYNLTYRLSIGLKTGYRFYPTSMNNARLYTNSGILLQAGLFYMF